jgi:3D (Asp-Asp-Asp) domain-containing protein
MVVLSPLGMTQAKVPGAPMMFIATAYSVSGVTAKGNITEAGTAAADPSVIPLGSKVRVTGAGAYSGVYSVTDTGSKVIGRTIDLYIPNTPTAKVFGRKQVQVQILTVGDNVKNLPETAPKVPESQLAPAQKSAAAH